MIEFPSDRTHVIRRVGGPLKLGSVENPGGEDPGRVWRGSHGRPSKRKIGGDEGPHKVLVKNTGKTLGIGRRWAGIQIESRGVSVIRGSRMSHGSFTRVYGKVPDCTSRNRSELTGTTIRSGCESRSLGVDRKRHVRQKRN